MGPAGHLSKFMHHRCALFSIRSANVRDEIWLMDIQRRPSIIGSIQQQEFRRFIGLLEIWNMGHYRSARLLECLQKRWTTNRNGHYVQHHNSTQNSILHREFDSANCIDFIPLCARVLFTS